MLQRASRLARLPFLRGKRRFSQIVSPFWRDTLLENATQRGAELSCEYYQNHPHNHVKILQEHRRLPRPRRPRPLLLPHLIQLISSANPQSAPASSTLPLFPQHVVTLLSSQHLAAVYHL